jgi:hypothetical protein
MIKKNNFVSIVILGSFNPGILSIDFLQKTNIVDKNSKIEELSPKTPIFRAVNIENIKVTVELERFQALESGIEDFNNTAIINLAYNYINNLRFTPISIMGINLNSNLELDNISKFQKKINDKEILGIFNANSLIQRVEKIVSNEKEDIFTNFNLKFNISQDKSININLQKKDVIYVINYNFEVKKINEKNKLFIKDNYPDLVNQFDNVIKDLFK